MCGSDSINIDAASTRWLRFKGILLSAEFNNNWTINDSSFAVNAVRCWDNFSLRFILSETVDLANLCCALAARSVRPLHTSAIEGSIWRSRLLSAVRACMFSWSCWIFAPLHSGFAELSQFLTSRRTVNAREWPFLAFGSCWIHWIDFQLNFKDFSGRNG